MLRLSSLSICKQCEITNEEKRSRDTESPSSDVLNYLVYIKWTPEVDPREHYDVLMKIKKFKIFKSYRTVRDLYNIFKMPFDKVLKKMSEMSFSYAC